MPPRNRKKGFDPLEPISTPKCLLESSSSVTPSSHLHYVQTILVYWHLIHIGARYFNLRPENKNELCEPLSKLTSLDLCPERLNRRSKPIYVPRQFTRKKGMRRRANSIPNCFRLAATKTAKWELSSSNCFAQVLICCSRSRRAGNLSLRPGKQGLLKGDKSV